MKPPGSTASTGAKLGLLGSLYFSQGLPFGFFTQAPAVDRYALPRLGRRKSWIVQLQLGAVTLLAALSVSEVVRCA